MSDMLAASKGRSLMEIEAFSDAESVAELRTKADARYYKSF